MSERERIARSSHKDTQIDGEVAKVRFSPGVVKSLAEIEATVRTSKHFDPDILTNLQELADGKNYTVRGAITNIALIVQEAEKHVRATDDEATRLALLGLFDQLMGSRSNSKPVTVITTRSKER